MDRSVGADVDGRQDLLDMSDWTVDSLKEHLETIMENRFRSQEESGRKLAHEMELRESKNNEFRGQLSDQAAKFPTRVEVEAKMSAIESKLNAKSFQVTASMVGTIVSLLIAVFVFASRF